MSEVGVEVETKVDVDLDVVTKTIETKIKARQKLVKKKKEYEDKAKDLEKDIKSLLRDNDIRYVKANDDRNGTIKLNKKNTTVIPFLTVFEKVANKYVEGKDVYVISRERLEQLALYCTIGKTELKNTFSANEVTEMEELVKVEEKYEFNAR